MMTPEQKRTADKEEEEMEELDNADPAENNYGDCEICGEVLGDEDCPYCE